MPTDLLFRDDAYLKECSAIVTAINERGGIVTDQTVFYATGGGQPGDTGIMRLADGSEITIATTVYGDVKTDIVHVPAEIQSCLILAIPSLCRSIGPNGFNGCRSTQRSIFLQPFCPIP